MISFHAVRFYDSTESLASIVVAFLGAGWITHEPALVIASPARQEAIAHALGSISFSMDALQCSGNLCLLDANDTLQQFMVNGVPDPVRFGSVMRGAFSRIGGPEKHGVRIYDEMADVLWKHGQPAAALRLETLWDDLTRHRNCAVVCGHGVDDVHGVAAPRSLCSHHSHVLAPNGLPHPVSGR